MEIDTLKAWRSSLEAAVGAMRDRIQSLNLEIQRKTQQIELISKLIDSADATNSAAPVEVAPYTAQSLPNSQSVTPAQVKDCVYEILREANCPMNINHIHAEFLRRGYAIPGKGTRRPFRKDVAPARDVDELRYP